MKFYREPVETVANYFAIDPTRGLTNQQVATQKKIYGINNIDEIKKSSFMRTILHQFSHLYIYLLLILASITFLLGSQIDALAIGVIILISGITGTIYEYYTKNLLIFFSTWHKQTITVLRNGLQQSIDSDSLVPGDIIALKPGMKVPADARIISSNDLTIDESIITGESEPVVKTTSALEHPARIQDQCNMVFQGTFTVQGYGYAVVTATGTNTELCAAKKIIYVNSSNLVWQYDAMSALQRLTLINAFVYIVFLGVALQYHLPLQPGIMVLTIFFICTIPPMLPTILATLVARGVHHMIKKNIFIKNLNAIKKIAEIQHTDALALVENNNESPLRIADGISITQEALGTDRIKSNVDLIILNNTWMTFINAINDCRCIFYTLQRIASYFFTTYLSELFIVLYAIIMGLPAPITPFQLLFLIIINNCFIGALATEQERDTLSEKKWVVFNLFNKKLWFNAITTALLISAGTIIIFYNEITNLEQAQTMCFVTLVMFQLFNAWNCRSTHKSVFQVGLCKNKWLILATMGALLLLCAILYVSYVQTIAGMVFLPLSDWLVAIATASSIFVITECRKICMQCYRAWRFDASREKN